MPDKPRPRLRLTAGTLGFLALHLACGLVVLTGWSPLALLAAAASYALRAFGLTAGYHRYFAHASFRTSRAFQLALACLGAAAVQKGPLWWAGHHRGHHRWSDTELDVHSPRHGFWWSHAGWFLTGRADTDWRAMRGFARFPELRFVDAWHWAPALCWAAGLYALGEAAARFAPGLGADGPQLFAWGFCVSTVALYHATFAVNSLAHRWGGRRYDTADDSRNNALIALLTLGEGWHNNHHRCPFSARQGFLWWELDATHLALRALAGAGVVWGLREPPQRLLTASGPR